MTATPRLNFVIARYTEDVDWLDSLPADARIYLYNKGPAIDPTGLRHPGIGLIPLLNSGRESGTYLHHLMHAFEGEPDDITVFAQGDPFVHAPAFLDLVARRDRWRDVQPLSLQWLESRDFPPRSVLENDRRDWIDDIPVRAERFALQTWAPLAFMTESVWWIGHLYRGKHSLDHGANMMAHFLRRCGLPALAERAEAADVGVFPYGAILAVRHHRITAFLEQSGAQLARMLALANDDVVDGYMFERSWMHLFGEPFVTFAPVVQDAAAEGGVPQTRSATASVDARRPGLG